jgi:hypothetical protein
MFYHPINSQAPAAGCEAPSTMGSMSSNAYIGTSTIYVQNLKLVSTKRQMEPSYARGKARPSLASSAVTLSSRHPAPTLTTPVTLS